jgi:predicted HD superfamily hydrolase involved in NAD metabolism
MWNENEIQDYLKHHLDRKRYEHTSRVVDEAMALSDVFDVDRGKARKAALLHDAMKNRTTGFLVSHLESDEQSRADALRTPEVLHGFSAALFSRSEAGIEDEDILNAIRYHTTGRADMSDLEKVVYLADVIEAGRSYEGLEPLRELAYRDLDRAMLMALEMSLTHLREKGRTIDSDTIRARDYFHTAAQNSTQQTETEG